MSATLADPVFFSTYLESIPQGWPAIEKSLPMAEGIPLHQSWTETQCAEFRPGWARIGWTDEAVLVHVELEDENPFSPINEFNEPAFMVGDVVEVFLHADTNKYIELHSTPKGALLQLHFPMNWRKKIKPGDPAPSIYELCVYEPVCGIQTRLTEKGWSAFLAIPHGLIGARPERGAKNWGVSICRYDYARGDKNPVISSTSVMPVSDFHLVEHWSPLKFV